jgi:hypothetical protein
MVVEGDPGKATFCKAGVRDRECHGLILEVMHGEETHHGALSWFSFDRTQSSANSSCSMLSPTGMSRLLIIEDV